MADNIAANRPQIGDIVDYHGSIEEAHGQALIVEYCSCWGCCEEVFAGEGEGRLKLKTRVGGVYHVRLSSVTRTGWRLREK